MQKLNINGIKITCEDINCNDNEMILNLLISINNAKYYDIKKIMHYIKKNCNIEEILNTISNSDIHDLNNVIDTIDKLINELTKHNNKLKFIRGDSMTTIIENNEAIPDLELQFEAIDCTDKIILLKVPSINIIKPSAIKNVLKAIKDKSNAKEIIALPDVFKFTAMDREEAINTINGYIDELYSIKERIEEEYDNISEVNNG
jgi:hypothetical protein